MKQLNHKIYPNNIAYQCKKKNSSIKDILELCFMILNQNCYGKFRFIFSFKSLLSLFI